MAKHPPNQEESNKGNSIELKIVAKQPQETTGQKIKIGISIGDINGIGPEVIIKTFSNNRMLDFCVPIIYGSSRVISYHRKVLKAESFSYNIINSASYAKPNVCNILNCWNEEVAITIGRANQSAGKYAYRALEMATNDLEIGKIDALVTAPVNKSVVNSESTPFSGHTEYLTKKFEIPESLMFLVSDAIRVGLVTNHLPISQVAQHINKKLIKEKIMLMYQSLQKDFGIMRPKIAVLGLNPHAGDTGLIGKEEEEIIQPAIADLKKKDSRLIFGPYAADAFFGLNLQKQFDGILAMYHDQGLIPFKALSFGNGINFTAGLPVVRTSPDHGTAYDIAGKNIASEKSLRNAIYMALDILKNRALYAEITANPLQANQPIP